MKQEIKMGNPSLTIGQIEHVLNSFIENKVHIPLMLWGKPGIGKSEIVKKVAKDNNYKLIDIRLSQKENVDIAGMPVTNTIEINGEKHNVLDFHPPRWFVEALFEGNCILFFDELNRGRPETLQAIFQIIYDRTLNGKKLPETVLQCAAGNPPEEDEDVVELGKALKDRFVHVLAEPCVKEWMAWAEGQDFLPAVIEFAGETEDFFGKPIEFHIRDLKLESGGRTTARANQIEKLKDIPNNIKLVLYIGLYGPEKGMEFWKKMRENSERIISLEDLKELSSKTKKRIKNYMNGENEDQRIDLLKQTCLKIEKNPEDWFDYYKNVVYFLSEIPLSLAHTTLQALSKNMSHDKKYLPFIQYCAEQEFMKKIRAYNLKDFDLDESLDD